MKFINNLSLKKKLRFSFLFVTFVSTLLTILFSMFYFSGKMKEEAANNMRNNILVAQLVYDSKMSEVKNFTQSMSNDKALQILLDLNIKNKIVQYIKEIVKREKNYQIIILNKKGEEITNIALQNSLISKYHEASELKNNEIVKEVLKGNNIISNELIRTTENKEILSITSGFPVSRANLLIGAVLVRYILNENVFLVNRIKELLRVKSAIYYNTVPIAKTDIISIDSKHYEDLMTKKDSLEIIDLRFGGQISEYKTLFDMNKKSIGVLEVNVSANSYVYTLISAMTTFFIIMILCVGIAYFLVILLSKSILIPINQLLTGANKIAAGDLSYEIIINLQDEIGNLSMAFNQMRVSLNDKIGQIQHINEELDNKVKEKTQQLETTLSKMEKFLSPQVYSSIVVGTRDSDTKKHFRKKLTVFFSDVVGFTATTDSLEAEDISDLLNNYLDNMAKIALKYNGTIDKFIGDAVMVFFGDPEFINDKEHAVRAVKMALEMRDKMIDLRNEWVEKGIDKPLHIRMGINTGYCTIGSFGSENKMDYTIIGGNVNLAARLQSSADPDTILMSHETYSLVKDIVQCEYMGELSYKGLKESVKTYKIIRSIEEKNSIETDYLKITGENIILKKSIINKKQMTDEEKEVFIKSLKLAIAYTDAKPKHKE
ncbi:MAG: hypothetical protein A2086_00155 [Spirochaetes bacterium GWD1_27_9]|nr:MAG: hypothetical protein A2Z98_04195 [Spirochaetes bacterium GWB1_27_13]OHD20024.1 MAG: hypothetical protein A2Y34_08210 [Spirochaetes bacterium GWC1_27_15]OHD30485.1 MAG: hypothetical protein A2086_00155 [Spirochaetes bacterium GWD1_27_9]